MSEITLAHNELYTEEFSEMLKKENLEKFKTWLEKYNTMFYSVDNTQISLKDYTNFLKSTACSLLEHGSFMLFKYLSIEYENTMPKISYAEMLYHSMVYVYNVQQNKNLEDYTTNIYKATSFLSEIYRLDEDNFRRDINEYSVCKINPFQIAIISGDVDIVEFYIMNGANINLSFNVDNFKLYPLHLAIMSGNLEMLKHLIEIGLDINQPLNLPHGIRVSLYELAVILKKSEIVDFFKTEYGAPIPNPTQIDSLSKKVFNAINNSLFWAVENNNLLFTKFLIKNCGVNLNIKDSFGYTLLHIASKLNYLPIVQCLIENGADKEVRNKFGKTPLGTACSWDRLSIVRYLVEKNKANIEAKDIYGHTPLYYACERGNLPIVEYLVGKGADKEIKNNDTCELLHIACYEGRFSIIEYLIRNGVNIEAKNKAGNTALLCACERDRLPIVQYLIENKADIKAKNKAGNTALLCACGKGNLPIVEYLIEKGADKEARDEFGNTALHVACRYGHLPIVQYLIEKDVDIETKDKFENTPLHYACERGYLPTVEYLISKGANIEVKNEAKNTPLHVALKIGYKEIVEFLRQKQQKRLRKESENMQDATERMENGTAKGRFK